jgi:hypothetical protein
MGAARDGMTRAERARVEVLADELAAELNTMFPLRAGKPGWSAEDVAWLRAGEIARVAWWCRAYRRVHVDWLAERDGD